jgi:membrane fusion protein (multidrug efflux system)
MDLQNNKNKTKFITILGLMVVASGIVLAGSIIRGFTRVTTDDAYIAGRIHSIASKIPGTVKRVLINDNQGIKKGDVLVEIDPLDYEARLREAQAAVEAEKARLLDSEAGIKAAAANLEMQEATLNQAKLDQKRADALYQEKVIPKERHEKIMTAFDLALAQMKASREQLEKAKSTRELQKASVRQK